MGTSSFMTAAPARKVHASTPLPMVWTAAGSVYVIEEVQQALTKASQATQKQIEASCRAPDLPGIRTVIGGEIRNTLDRCYKSVSRLALVNRF